MGEKERAEGTVNVRTRDNHVHGMHTVDAVISVLHRERDAKSLVSLFGGGGSGSKQGSDGGRESGRGTAGGRATRGGGKRKEQNGEANGMAAEEVK